MGGLDTSGAIAMRRQAIATTTGRGWDRHIPVSRWNRGLENVNQCVCEEALTDYAWGGCYEVGGGEVGCLTGAVGLISKNLVLAENGSVVT